MASISKLFLVLAVFTSVPAFAKFNIHIDCKKQGETPHHVEIICSNQNGGCYGWVNQINVANIAVVDNGSNSTMAYQDIQTKGKIFSLSFAKRDLLHANKGDGHFTYSDNAEDEYSVKSGLHCDYVE